MYKLSLVDPNFRQGPKEVNAYFLPYSVGILWSFCRTSETVKNSFELDKLVWRREDIETLAQDIKDNAVVGFSCYIWNWKYNQALAKRLKELNPNIPSGVPVLGIMEGSKTSKSNVIKTLSVICSMALSIQKSSCTISCAK